MSKYEGGSGDCCKWFSFCMSPEWKAGDVQLGTNLMSSYHFTGKLAYLLLLRNPFSILSIGSSPHSSFFWASRRDGLLSTRQMDLMLDAKDLKFRTVCTHQLLPYMFAGCSTRRTSSIKVPLPGPTSIISTPLLFRPCAIHSATSHIPTSSPKTCDISGEVMKSPFCPNWSPS